MLLSVLGPGLVSANRKRMRQGWGSGREGWTGGIQERWDVDNQMAGEEAERNREEEKTYITEQNWQGQKSCSCGLELSRWLTETARFSL